MRYPSAIALLLMASSQAMAGDDPRKVIESDQARAAVMESRLRAIDLERNLLEAERRLDMARGSLVMFPTLVGIVTQAGVPVAEFADASGIRSVAVGAEVVPGWVVGEIGSNGVIVRSRAGNKRQIRVGTRGEQQ